VLVLSVNRASMVRIIMRAFYSTRGAIEAQKVGGGEFIFYVHKNI